MSNREEKKKSKFQQSWLSSKGTYYLVFFLSCVISLTIKLFYSPLYIKNHFKFLYSTVRLTAHKKIFFKKIHSHSLDWKKMVTCWILIFGLIVKWHRILKIALATYLGRLNAKLKYFGRLEWRIVVWVYRWWVWVGFKSGRKVLKSMLILCDL